MLMSISGEIARINQNISSAYSELEDKGASMPASRNSANLSATVGSLPSVSGKMDLMAYVSTASERQLLSNGQLFKQQGEYGVTDDYAANQYTILAKKSDIPTVPTATSDLINDSGFQNASQVQSTASASAASAVSAIPTVTLQITYDDDTTETVYLLKRAAV